MEVRLIEVSCRAARIFAQPFAYIGVRMCFYVFCVICLAKGCAVW